MQLFVKIAHCKEATVWVTTVITSTVIPPSPVAMACSPPAIASPPTSSSSVVLESESSVESIVLGFYSKTVNDIILTLCRHLSEHLSRMPKQSVCYSLALVYLT